MVRLIFFGLLVASVMACGAVSSSTLSSQGNGGKAQPRFEAIAHSQVWSPTDVAAMDIRNGPMEKGAFSFNATVTCDYIPKQLAGGSPKFACVAGDDELKVKYSAPATGYIAGQSNAEVFAEVAATRLLWALGFGADRMYPVRVICRKCPSTLGGVARDNDERLFDPATIERKMPGHEFEPDSAWSWSALDEVDEQRGGATVAQRDALKLLAVFLQHTDTKPKQQRLLCLGARIPVEGPTTTCEQPFMMISDLGLTFGKANLMNSNGKGMNYVDWSATPVWKPGSTGCVGELSKSFTGTLKDPVISEAGRAFLADLLMRLSDDQIRALFEASRVTLRLRDPGKAKSGFSTIEEWTDVFKRKRAEIVERRCASAHRVMARFKMQNAKERSQEPGLHFEFCILNFVPDVRHPSHRMAAVVGLSGPHCRHERHFLSRVYRAYMSPSRPLAFGSRVRAAVPLLVRALAQRGLHRHRQDSRRDASPGCRQPVAALSMYASSLRHRDAKRRRRSKTAHGFPSGHVSATTAFVVGWAMLAGSRRRRWAFAATWIAAMALSRMYLGRHFLGDVIGGRRRRRWRRSCWRSLF
jgi:hypothetical protein